MKLSESFEQAEIRRMVAKENNAKFFITVFVYDKTICTYPT